MTRARHVLVAAGALTLALRFAIGCAENDGEPLSTDPDEDANARPNDDASSHDAAVDGDASVDAAKPTCSADGLCYTPLPAKDSYDASAITVTSQWTFGLRGVSVAPDHTVWAVSASGHVLRWDGTEWQVKTVFSTSLRTVWAASATEIWVAGDRGLLARGAVNGSDVTFTRATYTTNMTRTMFRVVGTSPTDVWALGEGSFSSANRVWHLDATSDPPSFSPLTVPNTLGGSRPRLTLTALWTAGSDVWVAGLETSGTPRNLLAARWLSTPPDGGPPWELVPFHRDLDNGILATAVVDGVHLFAMDDSMYQNNSHLLRFTNDESKLDPNAEITTEGAYSWTKEFVDHFGAATGIWARARDDIWMVGKNGLVRHFDGTSWKLVRTSLTNVTPLLRDLWGIDAIVDPSGEQDLWIVGDDVVLHQRSKP